MAVDLITENGVGIISLNMPPANAYNLAMLKELQAVILVWSHHLKVTNCVV